MPNLNDRFDRRVLVLSTREVDRRIWNASAYEFEDTIAAVEGTAIVSPRLVGAEQGPAEKRVLGVLERHAYLSVKRTARPSPLELSGRYDLCFVRVMSPDDFDSFANLELARERSRRMVCWVEELWLRRLQYRKELRALALFDHVFVGHSSTVTPLQEIIGRPCHHLAPAVDALRFCPYPEAVPRPIDLYMMGRRTAELHRTLLAHAAKHPRFWYLYDSAKLTDFTEDGAQHRELVAGLIRRTRYFVVNRAKMNAPDQTEGQQEFGPRYFEGAAGGAILVGDAPTSGPFPSFFDWPDCMFHVSSDSSELLELIAELDADPARTERARRANVVNVLRRHDWVKRWQLILDTVDLPAAPGSVARMAELEKRAALIESASPVS
jgi:hypothetical protein